MRWFFKRGSGDQQQTVVISDGRTKVKKHGNMTFIPFSPATGRVLAPGNKPMFRRDYEKSLAEQGYQPCEGSDR